MTGELLRLVDVTYGQVHYGTPQPEFILANYLRIFEHANLGFCAVVKTTASRMLWITET
jgi:hypothetical protein